ncbi:unnamed protein product [Phyllotreta striolata]|uniref:SEFIR domain-containing protein n=1 Tax=Phyllotreta striolata TaxID=444603 RepID=A0A9N9XQ12_PHYSR|nr:unnamed protein product [Phyllotreta striolata]
MFLLALLLAFYSVRLDAFELCRRYETVYCGQKIQDSNAICNVTVRNSTENCEQFVPAGSDFLANNIGDVFLTLKPEERYMKLFLGFVLVPQWKSVQVKVSNFEKPNNCQAVTVSRNDNFKDNLLNYGCVLDDEVDPNSSFLLEVYSENGSQFSQKKIMFSLPDLFRFRDASADAPRYIFSYVDFTNPAKLTLKFQPLDLKYHVTHYKIEVFRQRETHAVMVDVRLIYAKNVEQILSFDYNTYSEEGYYYFALSEIGKYCSEDMCYKTLTPKVHISRKGRPLVIGIVGASFLIPFILFMFYWWNYKYRNQGLFVSDPIHKALVIFKPSFDKHNEVVSALINSIEDLSDPPVLVDRINLTKVKEKTVEKFCSDNLILATHIIYVNPPSTDAESTSLDYMTFNFLKQETKKATAERKLIVVRLPYSRIDSPSILSSASRFELIKDFQGFIKNFSTLQPPDFCKNGAFVELEKKIEAARIENENLMSIPEIVVTTDNEEPKEVDELIGG